MSSTRPTSSSTNPDLQRRLAIIGHPIEHSISPAIYNATLPAMGLDAVYEAWSTSPDDVPAAIERLREDAMLGMNVTVPHKQAVVPLLDQVTAAARAIGAVNCISKEHGSLIGHNTDKYGFIQSLLDAGFEPRGKRVTVLGAGGSARAVCVGLAEAGAVSITLSSRSHERVARLASDMRRLEVEGVTFSEAGWQDESFGKAVAEADLVVNCTPIGMLHTEQERESPLPADLLRPGLWVCDLVYNPSETVLLRQAAEGGANPVGGLEMLVLQAVESVRLWTGKEPPVDIMRTAARRALGFEE